MITHALLNKLHANDDELQKATDLMNAVLGGMAYSLHEKSGPTRPEALNKWEEMKQNLIAPRGSKQLKGARLDDNRPRSKPVFKCSFKQDVHPPPDPILLAAKAALNWAKRQYFDLVAAGEYFEDEDGLDAQAEREYLKMLEQSYRPTTWEQLAHGLHQYNMHSHEVH